jgi:hypothetical protein
MDVQRGPTVTSLVALSSRNICAGFADVTRASGVSLAHATQMLHAKFAYDVHHVQNVAGVIMQMLREPAARGAATRDVTFGPLCNVCLP